MTNATTAKEIKTMQTFTTADADRLLGLADQFMEDWEANEGKDDPDCAARRADWNAIRPLLARAPAMRTARPSRRASLITSAEPPSEFGQQSSNFNGRAISRDLITSWIVIG